ncbi:unnamed protein product [Urochloa decumbens]|uniref:Transcription repressor n=1 Tax=Urochloa decumbens TaxID=240449 RepID=A0ABC9D3A6_9POAL
MRQGMMSPGAGAKKRLGLGGVVGGRGFGLGCGCRDAKAVAVAASSASPYSSATATDTSTATTATTWRGARASAAAAAHHPSSAASGSTGTLTVPSASSSSFLWEDAGEEEEEVDCRKQREGTPAAAASFSGLLRQLNDLEQSVVSWGRKSTGKDCFSPPPPPPPLPARPLKQRAKYTGGESKEGYDNFSPPPPPPPPLPARPLKQRVAHSGGDSKEGHGNFSPPAPPTSFHLQVTQQPRKAKIMDEADRQAGEVHSKQPPPPPPPPPLPLPPEQQPKKAKSTEKGGKKEDAASIFPTSQAAAPKHRKAKSCDGGKVIRLEGSVAVVKQSEDPLSDFRRSMVNMVVENRIATGDELRELLRHFLALNAPHHHDAILRAFTEIWDEAFSISAKATTTPHRDPAAAGAIRRPTPPRQRTKTPTPTPPRRRMHAPTPPRVWR